MPAATYAMAKLLWLVRAGVVGAEDSGPSFENFLEKWDGIVESVRIPVGGGEVDAACEGFGVVESEDSLLGGEDFLEEWDGVVEPACILVGEGKAVAGVEGVGVVGSEDSGEGCEGFLV